MTTELQDKAWFALPEEFNEEVKKYYGTLHEQYKDYDGLHLENAKSKVQERIVTLEYLFNKHNLTPDTEYTNAHPCKESESKRMCLRHETKVCNLCHKCDIEILNPRY